LVLGDDVITLYVKKLSNFKQRQKLFDDFYRANLKKIIPPLIEKYEKKMDVKVKEFGIKKMKTRWGTCNTRDRRIWLNLELAKKPPQYLESIVVHEMVHFFEHRHNKNFFALMDKFMPDWKLWR
jgi:predicted metal-dependent hydrolase